MNDDVVTRLYRALVKELRRRGHPGDRPLQVSELYRDVIPYRAVRTALDVALNADYEDALLRLLAGERDLLRLEPEEARDELRREVESTYPSVGLFRKFSASKVWVNMPDETRPPPEETGDEAGPDAGEHGADTTEAAAEAAEPGTEAAEPGAEAAEPGTDEPGPEGPETVGSTGDGEARPVSGGVGGAGDTSREGVAELARTCPRCERLLPMGRGVRYCPHCGGEQRLRPCPRCSAALERGWRYCIACGYEVAG